MAGRRATRVIAREHYTDNSFFDREVRDIFASRFFVGTSFDFSEERSYYSFLMGKQFAITCRRSGGKMKAFRNVCLHRNCLIDPLGRGVRRFHCGYHGWQYGEDGALRGAPRFDLSRIKQKSLSELPMSESKGLCFVGLQQAPEVSEVAPLVSQQGVALSLPAFHSDEMEHQCNWKLLVENVLDREHLSQVHRESFVSAGVDSNAPVSAGGGDYTLWSRTEPKESSISRGLSYFSGARHHYLHAYVFPNLFLANTNNMVGFVNQLLPVDAGRTLLRWQLYELPALIAQPDVVREKVKKDAILLAEKVLLEDRRIVEMCQQGLSVDGESPQIQEQEEQILKFHSMYQKAMELV